MNKLRILDLFSGIGGFSLGLERTGGFETAAFCEIEPFPRKVLAKHWPEIHCHDDVKTLTKETLCKGYAENAVLNLLCKETGGKVASVRDAITHIKKNFAKETHQSTTNGPQSVERALSTIMAGGVLAAESPNTNFWQSTTSLTTETKNGQSTVALHGKSLSNENFLTIIKFFVITATWQNPSMVPAHIRAMLGLNHDVTKLTGDIMARDGIAIDVITGGFPCQDISTAGKQAGMGEGTRSGLWSEIVRLIGELRPRYVIVENVANLLSGPSERRGGWFGRVLGDLAECGYDAEWENIPAAALGAPHLRERVWVTAYPNGNGLEEKPAKTVLFDEAGNSRLRGRFSEMDSQEIWTGPRPVGAVPMAMGNGFPEWLGDIKGAGNAVVPQIPELIGRAILAAEAGA